MTGEEMGGRTLTKNGWCFVSTPEQERDRERRNLRVMHSGCLNRAHASVYWHGDAGRPYAFWQLDRAARVRRAYARMP